MPRFTQPVKDVLTLLLTIAVGIATGVYVDVRAKPGERIWPLIFLIGFSLVQVAVTLAPSKDMESLEVYREQEIAQIRLLNEFTRKIEEAVKSGRLEDALAWDQARAVMGARGRSK